MRSRKYRLCLALLLCTGTLFVYGKHRLREHYRTYGCIALGMTIQEIKELTSREPDLVCIYKTKRIVYFCNHFSFFGERPTPDMLNLTRCVTRDDIPDIYDAIQLLTDQSGRIEAYTWNGETYTINTKRGEVQGMNVKKLDEKFFEEEKGGSEGNQR